MDQNNICALVLGLLSSLALFGAFKALEGKIDSVHELTLGQLKQKTCKKLEMLMNTYKETSGNTQYKI